MYLGREICSVCKHLKRESPNNLQISLLLDTLLIAYCQLIHSLTYGCLKLGKVNMARPQNFNRINSRTIVAPLAAFVMAGLLYVYSRTSIQAAKRNAQRHREADGGQIDWRRENLRRHGVLKAPSSEKGPVSELVGEAKQQMKGEDSIKARANLKKKG